jgi:hypothetical protein
MLSNVPAPNPLHHIIVRGNIDRANGLSKQGFGVSLYGWLRHRPDSLIKVELVRPCDYLASPYDGTVGVTDGTGNFSLDLYIVVRADSLAIKISRAGNQVFVSSAFDSRVPSDSVVVEYSGSSSGCAGCKSVTSPSSRIDQYRYVFEGRTVMLPF